MRMWRFLKNQYIDPSRTNSNVTVEADQGSASAAASSMAAIDAYVLDGVDDEEDGL